MFEMGINEGCRNKSYFALAFVQELCGFKLTKETFRCQRAQLLLRTALIKYQRWFTKALPQLVYTILNARRTHNPAFEASPSRKIKQHYAKENC